MALIPQYSLYLIGEKRIISVMALRSGFGNSVWRVCTRDNQSFIVKKCADKWSWHNEIRGCEYLKTIGMISPQIYSAYANIIIFKEIGFGSPHYINENVIRSGAYALHALHNGALMQDKYMDVSYPTALNKMTSLAVEKGYEPIEEPVVTHGDFYSDNMVCDLDGQFIHMIDFEEIWGGDALTDFMVYVIETARMTENFIEAVDFSCRGYFLSIDEVKINTWNNKAQRMVLANSCYDVLYDWAYLKKREELVYDLDKDRPFIMTAIEEFQFNNIDV